MDVQPGQLSPGVGEGTELGSERNARKFALQVRGVALAYSE